MRINNISSTANFGKVYAVAAPELQLEKFKEKAIRAKGHLIVFDATDLYRNQPMASGFCSRAAHDGESVAMFITGEEDTDNVRFMRPGWTSLNGITQHIFNFYSLQQDGTKNPLRTIKRQMQTTKEPVAKYSPVFHKHKDVNC